MLLYSTLAILNMAVKNKRKYAYVPFSRNGNVVVNILYNMGYIINYVIEYNKIKIEFKYNDGISVFNGFFFISRPGNKKKISVNKLRQVYFKKKSILIISTKCGILTTVDALKKGTGGIILAEFK